jgi:BASS family bile acid:Na+ symporter
MAMFAIGGLLPENEVRQVAESWPMVLVGAALQYTVMPILGFSTAHLLKLDIAECIGVVMVGCVPGAMASNVLTLMARGHVSYSVSLTTTSTLLSPIAVPIGLWLLLGAGVAIDPIEVCSELLAMVVGPVILGYVFCRKAAWMRQAMALCGSLAANLAILWIIAVVVALNRDTLFQASGRVLLALVLVNGLGYAAGYAGATALGLSDPMRRALTLEIGMQNAGLGTTLVLQLFPESPAAAIPTALYTFGCMFTGSLLARWWSSQRPKTIG